MVKQDKLVLETVRSIDSEFSKAITAKDRKKPFDDEEAIKLLSKLAKQRKEAADLYTEGDRPELAAKELAELKVINTYLPHSLTEQEIKDLIDSFKLFEPEAKMGEIIKWVQLQAARSWSIVDGKLLSTLVKESLVD